MYLLLLLFGGLVAKSCPTLATPWTVACQAPLSMGFFRQEYWSRLPFPSPRDLPNPGIEPTSRTLQEDSLPAVAQTGKHLPTMWYTWVQSLGWEDLLEKEMAIHSSILAWKIPRTEEESGRLQSMGLQRVGHD